MKKEMEVYAIAAIFGLLPKRWRYCFFAHFHSELREHFSKPMKTQDEIKQLSEKILPCFTILSLRKDKCILKADVYFGGLTLPLRLCWKYSDGRRRFMLENSYEVVCELVEVVRSLGKDEQRLLWTILDDAIVDYEDFLIANDQRWLERLNRARKEKGRPLEKVRSELLGQR